MDDLPAGVKVPNLVEANGGAQSTPIYPLKNFTHTLTLDAIERLPLARECLLGKYPIAATSAVVAMGGVGKTTTIVWDAIELALDGVETLFISAEDGEDDYQSKLHNALFSRDRYNRPYHDANPIDVAGRVHIMNLKGMGKKLVTEGDGSFIPSQFSSDLSTTISVFYPKVKLIVFETVSRFAGGEDNERMEAIVSACDAIAVDNSAACLLVHHTGKQARENVIDLYSGRGGSALGDNTRSMIVLTRLSGGDKGYMGEQEPLVDYEDIEAGKVFEVKHVRNSYGITADLQYFATREGICNGPVIQRLKVATDNDKLKVKLANIEATTSIAQSKIYDIIKKKGGWVSRKFFDHKTHDLIGVTQMRGRSIISEMLEAGLLAAEERKQLSGQIANVLVVSSGSKGVSS